jgi:hypothetical protein
VGTQYDNSVCERAQCGRHGESRPLGLVVVCGGGWKYEVDLDRCERNMIPVCVCRRGESRFVVGCCCVYACGGLHVQGVARIMIAPFWFHMPSLDNRIAPCAAHERPN